MQLTRALCGVAGFMLCAAFADAQVDESFKFPRAWDRSPAVVELDDFREIVAIGDVHGDARRLIGVLKAGGLIDGATPVDVKPAELRWAGNSKVVVVVGDMIDKAPSGGSSVRVVALLRALKAKAEADYGKVILLMGNHEAEFLANPAGKADDLAGELAAAGIDPRTVANCQDPATAPEDVEGLGKFLCELPVAARIGEWFFSHAGDTNGRTIPELTADIQAAFASRATLVAFLENAQKNTIVEARLNQNEPGRIRWIDKPVTAGAKADTQKLLALYLGNLSTPAAPVKYIVQGHQPGNVLFPDGTKRAKHDFFQRYGTLFLIDSGMSASNDDKKKPKDTSLGGVLYISRLVAWLVGPGNKSEAVPIMNASVFCANGKGQMIWDYREKQKIAAQHCGL